MEIFIGFYFVILCLVTITRFFDLHTKEYPYKKDVKKKDDLIDIILSVGLAIWSGILLFGGN